MSLCKLTSYHLSPHCLKVWSVRTSQGIDSQSSPPPQCPTFKIDVVVEEVIKTRVSASAGWYRMKRRYKIAVLVNWWSVTSICSISGATDLSSKWTPRCSVRSYRSCHEVLLELTDRFELVEAVLPASNPHSAPQPVWPSGPTSGLRCLTSPSWQGRTSGSNLQTGVGSRCLEAPANQLDSQDVGIGDIPPKPPLPPCPCSRQEPRGSPWCGFDAKKARSPWYTPWVLCKARGSGQMPWLPFEARWSGYSLWSPCKARVCGGWSPLPPSKLPRYSLWLQSCSMPARSWPSWAPLPPRKWRRSSAPRMLGLQARSLPRWAPLPPRLVRILTPSRKTQWVLEPSWPVLTWLERIPIGHFWLEIVSKQPPHAPTESSSFTRCRLMRTCTLGFPQPVTHANLGALMSHFILIQHSRSHVIPKSWKRRRRR